VKAVDLQKLSRFDLESGSLCGSIEMGGESKWQDFAVHGNQGQTPLIKQLMILGYVTHEDISECQYPTSYCGQPQNPPNLQTAGERESVKSDYDLTAS
jgi:hypothetical protein